MRRLRPIRRYARQRVPENDAERDLSGQDLAGETPEQTDADDAFPPFVPVESSAPRDELEEELDESAGEAALPDMAPDAVSARHRERRFRLRLPRLPRFRWRLGVRLNMLVWAGGLVAAGIFGTLLNQGRIGGDLETWWPLGLIAVATAWLLIALVRRQVASFLSATVCAGVGLSFLLSTQGIAGFEETLLGIVLVTLGLGIVVRGFLLRQRVAV